MSVDNGFTKSLLHFDGADTSTTFTDESGKVWTPAADAQIDTAQSKFSGASIKKRNMIIPRVYFFLFIVILVQSLNPKFLIYLFDKRKC